jgi:predicted metalloprotease with PDZ domain
LADTGVPDELLTRACAGDEAAREAIYRVLAPATLTLIRRVVGQRALHSGDVIVAVNGTNLSGPAPARQVVTIMHDVKPDSRVSVRILRDGKAREFTLTARASPSLFVTTRGMPDMMYALPPLKGAFMFHRPLMDMEPARLGRYFGSDRRVLVVRAPADGGLKLEDGDVILAIDGRQPSSGSHATRILASYQPGEKVTLRVLREHRTLDIEATLPASTHPCCGTRCARSCRRKRRSSRARR